MLKENLFREMILNMEDHDDLRRLSEPETWNLQKHLIVDFIQTVTEQVWLQSLYSVFLEM